MNRHEIPSSITARDGLNLHLAHWPHPTPKGVVVMLHGLTEHARRHAITAAQMLEAGWSVVGPDMRGHGLSGGVRGGLTQDHDLLHDLAAVLDTVAACYPSLPRVVLGHSTGGAVAARFAAALAQPLESAPWVRPIDGLMLSSPALEASMGFLQKAFLTTMGHLIQDVPLPVVFKLEWVSSDPAVIAEFEQDPLVHRKVTARLASFIAQEGIATLRKAPQWACPTLLLFTPDDRLISPQACERFGAAVPATLLTLHRFPGLAHDLLREPGRGQVHQAMTAWLRHHFADQHE